MNNAEYYKELIAYHLNDYDFHKSLDLQAEEIKTSTVRMLENRINELKERIPEDESRKMGKW